MVQNHFGYWVFGRDMLNVNLKTMKDNGVTDIFLNYAAFSTHGEPKVLSWIQEAKQNSINVHIWMQCFYDGSWHNPVVTDLTNKINEAKKYANMKDVYGVHLDYLRYPGTAYKTTGGAEAITNFVKKIREDNPKTFLSCAVMPESEDKKYYGQDIEELGKIVNALIPMQYKGNYQQGNDWLASTSKNFSSKANIWSGLQSYRSDDNATPLPATELTTDAKTCLNNGAKGVMLFRYGLSPNVNFTVFNTTNVVKKSKRIVRDDVLKMAQEFKDYVEAGKGILYKATYHNVEYITPEMTFAFIYCLYHLKSNFDIPLPINWCQEAKGDDIVEDIYADDYKKQAMNVYNYILKNKQIPNYVTTIKSKKKVNIDLFTYCLAKILVWFKNHGELPNYCTYDYKDLAGKKTTKKYGRSTKTGCDNRGQNNGYYCGPHMAQEIVRNLTGVVVPQSTIASVMGTTSAGTGHSGIETFFAWFNRKYGYNLKVEWKNFSEVGWDGINNILESDNQDMGAHELYRYTDGHYTNYDKVYGNSVDVHNSLGSKCNQGCYCGYTENRSKSEARGYLNGISQKSILIVTRE